MSTIEPKSSFIVEADDSDATNASVSAKNGRPVAFFRTMLVS